MRRVVITGLGLVSPLGCGDEIAWERLTAGRNAARRIENFDVSDLSCQVACQVPRGDGTRRHFNPNRLDGAEGAAQGRRLHHLRDGRRHAGAERRGLAADRL